MLETILEPIITTILIITPIAAYVALKGMFEIDDNIKYGYKVKELKKLLNKRKDSDSEDSGSEDE